MFESLLVGENVLKLWLAGFLLVTLAVGIWTGWLKARKIQPRGFKWKTFRNEVIFSAINVTFSGAVLGGSLTWLMANGWISVEKSPASWWVIALEYALYFFAFDTWFYWLHRWMHKEPVYTWVHKLHHLSTSPNVVTTFSVNPLESFINGGFVPLFVTLFTVHDQTMLLIAPTNVIMGIYVHSGYEFLPRWWNRTWLSKWFISTTFHDQHHRYFTCNFGGYTTIWDWLCGTVRPKYVSDFERAKDRLTAGQTQAVLGAHTDASAQS